MHCIEYITVLRAEHSMVISVDRVDSFDEHSTPLHDGSSKGTRNKRITRPHNGEIAVFPKSVTRQGSATILLYSAWDLNQSNTARERGKRQKMRRNQAAHICWCYYGPTPPKTLIIPPNSFDQHCKKSFFKKSTYKIKYLFFPTQIIRQNSENNPI